jgi:homocysteine S-methyltransferase
MSPLAPFLEDAGFVMLDGGLSTQLERLGADLGGELWTSRVLLERPELVLRAHTDFLSAGADIIATSTYQSSIAGFMRAGLTRSRAADLMREAVSIAIQAREDFWAGTRRNGRIKPLVAASLGPYGACLHDGSEYHGNYAVEEHVLAEFHHQRIALLEQAGADLFAFETIPSLLEAEVILAVLESFPGIRAWISFCGRDGQRVAHGERFAECVARASESPQILAVGVNCTAPSNIPSLLASVENPSAPLAVYPNSGEHWDAVAGEWRGDACAEMDVVGWHTLGARLIGGCCRTAAEDIRRMREELGNALS